MSQPGICHSPSSLVLHASPTWDNLARLPVLLTMYTLSQASMLLRRVKLGCR